MYLKFERGRFIYKIQMKISRWKFTLLPMLYLTLYSKGYKLELGFFTIFIVIRKIDVMEDDDYMEKVIRNFNIDEQS